MFRTFLLIAFLFGCASGPTEKKLTYMGEPLDKIGEYGLLVGHVEVPIDGFPHDRKTTIIYLENINTKQTYQYGETRGPFFMKLPPGDYVINELWVGGGCNTSTGLMLSSFFSELPDSVAHVRNLLEKPVTHALGFKIHKGKMSDIGNLLMTCFEWDVRDKFKKDFTNYIQDGKFQVYRPLSEPQNECGCRILRKVDAKVQIEMKRALKED